MRRWPGVLLGLGVVMALVLIDHWVFRRAFDVVLWRWYIAEGAQVGLATAIASLAWGDLDRHAGLISSHPLDYLGSWLQLAGLPIYSIGAHAGERRAGRGLVAADRLLAVLFGVVVAALLFAWVIVVVPMQYFVFLICGGPARFFLGSARRPIARLDGHRLDVDTTLARERTPNGWWDASMSDKPVTLTSLVSALVLAAWSVGGALLS